jgi:hypothetical protein
MALAGVSVMFPGSFNPTKKVPYFQIDICNVQDADAIFIYSDKKMA